MDKRTTISDLHLVCVLTLTATFLLCTLCLQICYSDSSVTRWLYFAMTRKRYTNQSQSPRSTNGFSLIDQLTFDTHQGSFVTADLHSFRLFQLIQLFKFCATLFNSVRKKVSGLLLHFVTKIDKLRLS